jgi:hypothetical protein
VPISQASARPRPDPADRWPDLAVELAMIAATRPGLLAEVTLDGDWLTARRGPEDLALDGFRLSEVWADFFGYLPDVRTWWRAPTRPTVPEVQSAIRLPPSGQIRHLRPDFSIRPCALGTCGTPSHIGVLFLDEVGEFEPLVVDNLPTRL